MSDREITQTWDGLTLSGRTDPDHGTTAYTYDPMGTITTQTGTATTGGGTWLLGDALGSTLAQVSPGGEITQATSWDPGGQQAFHTTGWDARVGYTGEQTDAGLGLVNFYARSYDPTTAAFTTPDTWGGLLREPQTLHRYAYVLGDPLTTTTDVLGYWPSWAESAGNWIKDTASTVTKHAQDNWRTYAAVAAGVVVSSLVVAAAGACIAATAGLCGVVVAGVATTVVTAVAAGAAGSAAAYAYVGDDGQGTLSWAGFASNAAAGAVLGGVGAGVSTGLTNVANRITAAHKAAAAAKAAAKAAKARAAAAKAVAANSARAGTLSATTQSASRAAKIAPEIKTGSMGGPTAGKRFPQSVKNDTLADNPTTCVYCLMETNRPQIDHVIPKSLGGNATLKNVQTTCGWCNSSKGARSFPVNPPPGFRGFWPPEWW